MTSNLIFKVKLLQGKFVGTCDQMPTLSHVDYNQQAALEGITKLVYGIIKDDPYWDEQNTKPYWFCESCGFKDEKKAMPIDREKFYAIGKFPKCSKCRSETFIPVGF